MINKKDLTPEMFSAILSKISDTYPYKSNFASFTQEKMLNIGATPEQIIDSLLEASKIATQESDKFKKMIPDIINLYKDIKKVYEQLEHIKSSVTSMSADMGNNIFLKAWETHNQEFLEERNTDPTVLTYGLRLIIEILPDVPKPPNPKTQIATLNDLKDLLNGYGYDMESVAEFAKKLHNEIEQELQRMDPPENAEAA